MINLVFIGQPNGGERGPTGGEGAGFVHDHHIHLARPLQRCGITQGRRLKDLDELVRKMLQTVVDDPNEASRMRKFMSYYLPTTLKLLQSYRTMKTRGVSYSEMNTTRENLIHALDMILQAAQKQLDAMHKDDMLDMSADMDVLEQMLKRDGYMESVLSESLKEANRQQQNASVPYSTQQADLHTSGTAAARQMNQGAPVLKMPEEDIPEADRQQKKFYQN